MKINTKLIAGLLVIIGITGTLIYSPLCLLAIILIIGYIFVTYAILLLITKKALRENYNNERKRINAIVLGSAVFLYIGAFVINHYLFPNKLHPISLTGNAIILVFTVFAEWNLIRRRKKPVLIGTLVFILSISLLAYTGLKTYKYMEPSSFDALKSLPYLTWVPIEGDTEKAGVTIYNRDPVCKGINIYAYNKDTKAYLMDMSGSILHTWDSKTHHWHHIEMYSNGDLLGISEDEDIVKMNWNSEIIWVNKERFHHDLAISENGDIYALARKDEIVFYNGLPLPILSDYILVLSNEGKIKKSIAFFKILKDKIPPQTAIGIYKWILEPHIPLIMLENKIRKHLIFEGWHRHPTDIFHINSVEIVDRTIEGFCNKGDLLVCSRNLNTIGILDVEKQKLTWQWGQGDLRMPHHPTLLENGNILVFDNGWEREYSRVVELNPLTKKIVWEYRANPPEDFYSLRRGANQRLPNGNTLITESDRGRVFEVAVNGEIVWEFYGTEIKDKKRRAIYRMMRIVDTKKYPFLEALGGGIN